jgi:hypothetical protein
VTDQLTSAASLATGAPAAHRRRELRVPRVEVGPVGGRLALLALGTLTVATVAVAAAGPSVLVPRSANVFPNWESGPLRMLGLRVTTDPVTMGVVFSCAIAAMMVAYAIVVAASRTLSMRTIAIAVVVLQVVILLGPPLQLTDLFNYLGYARLGALHHFNPYTHVIRSEAFDPIYRFTSWHSLRSPYGPLFTALTYPLASMSLPVAYWVAKTTTIAFSLGFVALVWHCARRLGRDPRFAVAFVALNPVFLVYAVAGFHNDFFMLVPAMGAMAALLARRDRTVGALMVIAMAVKFTMVLLLPFLLLAAITRERRIRILTGCFVAAIPVGALWIAVFGLTLPNLAQQSTLLTEFSIPNVVGLLAHVGGGTSVVLAIATLLVIAVVVHQLWRQPDWIAGAGWSTAALLASLAWLVPWYVVWLLPLAALSRSVRLRRVAIVLTVFVAATFVPVTDHWLKTHDINLLRTAAGHASRTLQNQLAR